MRQRVDYSGDTWGWTIFWLCVCAVIFFLPLPGFWWWLWTFFFIYLIVMALCWTPMYVVADPEAVEIKRPLRSRRIPLTQIKSVELVDPKTDRGSAASRGFFGWWGKGKDAANGTYTSYVGDRSSRYLITLQDGDRIMVSSKDAPQMVAYIKERLENGKNASGAGEAQ